MGRSGSVATSESLLGSALSYTRMAHAVFPLQDRGKKPHIEKWSDRWSKDKDVAEDILEENLEPMDGNLISPLFKKSAKKYGDLEDPFSVDAHRGRPDPI